MRVVGREDSTADAAGTAKPNPKNMSAALTAADILRRIASLHISTL